MAMKPAPRHGYRRLLRRVLSVESGLRSYRPRRRPPPEKPDRADEVLALLAEHHRPGDVVGHRQMKAVGVEPSVGGPVRAWAKSVGLWPYADPSSLPAAWAHTPRRKKGGGS
jgi:hypothetical protein